MYSGNGDTNWYKGIILSAHWVGLNWVEYLQSQLVSSFNTEQPLKQFRISKKVWKAQPINVGFMDNQWQLGKLHIQNILLPMLESSLHFFTYCQYDLCLDEKIEEHFIQKWEILPKWGSGERQFVARVITVRKTIITSGFRNLLQLIHKDMSIPGVAQPYSIFKLGKVPWSTV